MGGGISIPLGFPRVSSNLTGVATVLSLEGAWRGVDHLVGRFTSRLITHHIHTQRNAGNGILGNVLLMHFRTQHLQNGLKGGGTVHARRAHPFNNPPIKQLSPRPSLGIAEPCPG